MTEDIETKVDREFGAWLMEKRRASKRGFDECSRILGISPFRLKQIEAGSAKRGITWHECNEIAVLFDVALDEVEKRATGVWNERKPVA